jgi:hypothetical protein
MNGYDAVGTFGKLIVDFYKILGTGLGGGWVNRAFNQTFIEPVF